MITIDIELHDNFPPDAKSVKEIIADIEANFPGYADYEISHNLTPERLATEEPHILIQLAQSDTTPEQERYLNRQEYIRIYNVKDGPMQPETTLEPSQEMKREVADLQARVGKLEGNNNIKQGFVDFFNQNFPPVPKQETIDQGRLRDLIYAVEARVQRAQNSLAPIFKDETLSRVETDLAEAMDSILDLRAMLGEE